MLFRSPPSLGELYFMRIMLNHIRGPTCYEDLRTVGDEVYDTYRDACYALGLVDDDKEYIGAITEAHDWGNGRYLRQMFSMLLQSNSMVRPVHVWDNTWTMLSEDILYHLRRRLKNPGA